MLIAVITAPGNAVADGHAPSPALTPGDVVQIQLRALKMNDLPGRDAGIARTWAFAHPENKRMTGPVERFAVMIKNTSYSVLLNHVDHTIEPVSQDNGEAAFGVRIFSRDGNVYGCRWDVARVTEGPDAGNWMTIRVSPPVPLGSGT